MTNKQRSYFVPGLSPADRQLLVGVPRKASLSDEIAYLRLRISKLAEDPDRPTSEAATAVKTGREGDELLVRMMALLTRMVSVQAKLGEDSEDELARIGEQARRRLEEAARKAELEGDDEF